MLLLGYQTQLERKHITLTLTLTLTLTIRITTNPNHNANDLINVTSDEHNELINIITSSMLFGKNPRLAPIRIPDTASEETPNLKLNPNPHPNP